MAFLGQDLIGSKIIINNKYLEQVSNFNYCDCDVPYDNEEVLLRKSQNLHKFEG